MTVLLILCSPFSQFHISLNILIFSTLVYDSSDLWRLGVLLAVYFFPAESYSLCLVSLQVLWIPDDALLNLLRIWSVGIIWGLNMNFLPWDHFTLFTCIFSVYIYSINLYKETKWVLYNSNYNSGKGKSMKRVKRLVVSKGGSGGRSKYARAQDFYGSENIFYFP